MLWKSYEIWRRMEFAKGKGQVRRDDSAVATFSHADCCSGQKNGKEKPVRLVASLCQYYFHGLIRIT